MRNFIKRHPSLIFLIIGVIFFLAGDFSLPAFLGTIFLIDKLQRTALYTAVRKAFYR